MGLEEGDSQQSSKEMLLAPEQSEEEASLAATLQSGTGAECLAGQPFSILYIPAPLR